MAIIVVLNKENLATLHNTDTQLVALNQASIIQISHSKDDIASIIRSGNKLIVTLNNGEKITLEQFFNAEGSTPHSLVLPNHNGQFDLVEFDGKGKVINYNPIQHLTELATSSTWVNTQPTTVSAEEPVASPAWYEKSWVKPALVVLGIEAIYLTAFKNDDDSDRPKDTTAPATPTATIDAVGKVISGKAEAKAKVYVVDLQNNIIGEATADAEGNYSIQLKRDVTDGERVGVYAKDAAGNQSSFVAVTGSKDTIAPKAPEAQFNEAGSIVSGRAEAGSKVSLYSSDGKTLLAGPVTAGSDGSFSLSVNPPLAKDTQAQVIAQDTAGNQSQQSTVVVGQDTLAPAIAKLEVNSAGTQVKGYAEANSMVEVKNDKGQVLASTSANNQGYFELNLNPAVTDKSSTTIVVKDAAGNSTDAITLKPGLDTLAPEAVTASINAEGTVLTGTAEPNSKIKITITSNGQETTIGSGQADSHGKFSITLNSPLINNNSANVYATDAANNQSVATQVIGRKDTIAPSKVSLSTLTVADDVGEQKGNISQNSQTDEARPKFDGRGEANATLTIYDHGIAITTVKVKSDGTWTYTPDTDLSLGEHSFTFGQMDTSGNTSAMSDAFKFTVVAVVQPEVEVSEPDTVNLSTFIMADEVILNPTVHNLVLGEYQDDTVEPILAALIGEVDIAVATTAAVEPAIFVPISHQDDSLLQAQSYI
jgi:hypothetical protein